jgi:AcrR family transcriptional regulator
MTVPEVESEPRERRHDKEGRQLALLEAATSAFADYGYDAATTRDIAERAGCSEGLIHRYFGGKRGLLHAIIEAKPPKIVAQFEESCPAQDGLAAEIESLLLSQVQMMWDSRQFLRVAVSQACIDRDLGLAVGERVDERRVALIRERLEHHRAAGRIRADADIDSVAYALSALGFASGFVGLCIFERGREDVERHLRAAARAIAAGIATPAAKGKL